MLYIHSSGHGHAQLANSCSKRIHLRNNKVVTSFEWLAVSEPPSLLDVLTQVA